MSLSEKIREERKKRGWTQQELADLLGVSKSTVCNHEQDDHSLYPEMIARYMRIFGVSANYLFRDYSLMENLMIEDGSDSLRKYGLLDLQGKRVVDNSIDSEFLRCEEEQNGEYLKRPLMKDVSSYKETGILEVSECFMKNTVHNAQADSILIMPDDSMAPSYPKGTRLLLKNNFTIRDGQIGVFLADNEILVRRKEKDQIIAEDPSYRKITINEDCVCLAEVSGIEEK